MKETSSAGRLAAINYWPSGRSRSETYKYGVHLCMLSLLCKAIFHVFNRCCISGECSYVSGMNFKQGGNNQLEKRSGASQPREFFGGHSMCVCMKICVWTTVGVGELLTLRKKIRIKSATPGGPFASWGQCARIHVRQLDWSLTLYRSTNKGNFLRPGEVDSPSVMRVNAFVRHR